MLRRMISRRLRHPDKLAVVKNIGWMLSERTAQILVAIVIQGLLARRLGPAHFGLLQYAFSVTMVAGSVALCCGAEMIVPRLAQQPVQHQAILGAAFILRISGAALAYVCLVGVAYWTTDPIVRALLLVYGITVLLREPFGVATAWMQARTDNRPGVLMGFAGLGARLIIVIVLYLVGSSNPISYAAAWVVDALILAALLSEHCLSRRVITFSFYTLKPVIKVFLRKGFTLWIGLMGMYLFLRLDRIMLKPFVSPKQLGWYAGAMQISEYFSSIISILASSWAPKFIYQAQDEKMAWHNVQTALILMTSIGLTAASVIALCAPFISVLLFGSGFLPAASVLQLSIFASILAFVDGTLNQMILRQRAVHWIVIKWMAAVLAAFTVNTCLIPILGIKGALAGYAGGYLVAISISLLYIRSIFARPLRQVVL